MRLTARERQVLADLERQFEVRDEVRRPGRRSGIGFLLLAAGWIVCGLLFVAILMADWILAATAVVVGVLTLTLAGVIVRGGRRRIHRRTRHAPPP